VRLVGYLKRKTRGNVFYFYENDRQWSNKPAFVTTDKCSKNVRVLTSGEKIETVQ